MPNAIARHSRDAELLKLDGLTASGFKDIGFRLRKGEILGITGLADSGRNELAMAISGVVPAHSGSIRLEGNVTEVKSPAEAIERGIGYVPEDRLAEGLFLDKSIFQNEIALIFRKLCNSLGIVDQKQGRNIAASLMKEMRLNTTNLDLPVGALSGGNQQRVLIGRWLSIAPSFWCCTARPSASMWDQKTLFTAQFRRWPKLAWVSSSSAMICLSFCRMPTAFLL